MYGIKIDDNNRIVAKFTTSQLDDDMIEISQSEFENINMSKFKYVYQDGKAIECGSMPQSEKTHEEITEATYEYSSQIQDDTLLGIELHSDTNEKVTLAGNDALLLMELLMSIDEKLTQLLQPK